GDGRGSERRAHAWYRQAKEAKRGGRGEQESEHPHNTEKRGNPPRGPVEGRGCRVMEPWEGKMTGTPSPATISTRLQRMATLAREMPGVALRTLAQHIDIACLREAYRRTRKDGAVGVDQQTAEQYAEDLERNLPVPAGSGEVGNLLGSTGPAGAHTPR